jgi:hypothetical protein
MRTDGLASGEGRRRRLVREVRGVVMMLVEVGCWTLALVEVCGQREGASDRAVLVVLELS